MFIDSLFFNVKTSTIFHLSQPCVGGEARQVYPYACILHKWCLGDNALVFIWQRRGYDNGGDMFQNGVFCGISALLQHLYF